MVQEWPLPHLLLQVFVAESRELLRSSTGRGTASKKASDSRQQSSRHFPATCCTFVRREGKALAQKALPFPLALYTFSHSSSLSQTRSVQHALEAVSSCLSDVVQEQELQSLCEVGNAAPRWHEKLKTPTNSKKHVNMSALTLISICGGACKLSQRTGTAVARSAAVV